MSNQSDLAKSAAGFNGDPLSIDTANNRVGIGTSSPASLLHLSSASDTYFTIGTTNATADARIQFRNSGGTDVGGLWYATSGNNMLFRTNSAERMRIGSSGVIVNEDGRSDTDFRVESGSKSEALLVDASSDFIGFNGISSAPWSQTTGDGRMVYRLNQGSMSLTNNRSTGYSPLYINKFGTGSDNRGIAFYHDGGGSGTVEITSSGVTYNTSSDYRLKENVTDVTDGITRVKQLEPKRFNFIADPDKTVDGFLAHEAQAVVPEAVTGTHNEVDDDGNAVMQGIDQSKLVPLLTAALKESIAKIEALEARVTALEGS